MPTVQKLNVTFDGVNDVPRLTGQTPVEWFSKGMTTYSIWYDGPRDKFVFTGNLTGTDWKLKYLRPAGEDNKTIIKDLDAGAGREIRYLELGWNSDVDLISTRARYVFGWDGNKHDVQLGSGTTFAVNLYALENTVRTGTGWVDSIVTGGKDTIVISDAGAGSIKTGAGDANVTTGAGGVESIKTGDGNDTVNIGAGGAISIRTKDGNDKVTTGAGDVDSILTNAGNDVVVIGDGGGNLVRTDEGNDRVTTGNGWVELITTGDGNDVVNVGAGGAGIIRLGLGDDLVRVAPVAAGTGFSVNGGGGSDTLDFSKFSSGITFTLDGFGIYQNVTAPGSLTGGQGWFSETGIDNLIGTNKGDSLTGDGAINVLKGLGGNDRLFGGDSNDRLDGGNNNDRLLGQNGRDILIGGKGNDIMDGGKGNDTLRGNAGADVFVFGKGSGTDKVMDFADGVDTLRLVGHTGGFGDLTIADSGANLKITHDGGVILLMGEAGTTLTAADFDFV